jgi:hypothetical protein
MDALGSVPIRIKAIGAAYVGVLYGNMRDKIRTAAGAVEFALDLTVEAVTLYERKPNGEWQVFAMTRLDDPEFATAIRQLRSKAETYAGGRISVRLWLPPEQVLKKRAWLGEGQPEQLRLQAAFEHVARETIFRLQDIAIAVGPSDEKGMATILVAFAETWREARHYAERWGFLPGEVSTREHAEDFGSQSPIFRLHSEQIQAVAPQRGSHRILLAAALTAGAVAAGVALWALRPWQSPPAPPPAPPAEVVEITVEPTPPPPVPQLALPGDPSPAPGPVAADTLDKPDIAAEPLGSAGPPPPAVPMTAVPTYEPAPPALGPEPPLLPDPPPVLASTVPVAATAPLATLALEAGIAPAPPTEAPPPFAPPPVIAAIDRPVALQPAPAAEVPPETAAPPATATAPEETPEGFPPIPPPAPRTGELGPAETPIATPAGGEADAPENLNATAAARAVPPSPLEPGAAPEDLPPIPPPAPRATQTRSAATTDGDARADPDAPTERASERAPLPKSRPARLARRKEASPAISLPATAGAAGSEATAKLTTKGLPLDRAVLIGIMNLNTGRTALLRLPDGSFHSVVVGDVMDGWRVSAIGVDAMRVSKDGQDRTLLLVNR